MSHNKIAIDTHVKRVTLGPTVGDKDREYSYQYLYNYQTVCYNTLNIVKTQSVIHTTLPVTPPAG